MEGFEQSAIWRQGLAARADDPDSIPRERLRVAYRDMRERAALVAAEIGRDLPEFTVHDITHLDALWELASEIAGPGVRVNPLETFAFGAAVLVHDLGLGLAAYPGGLDDLERSAHWRDAVAAEFLEDGVLATPAMIDAPPAAIRGRAVRFLLRQLHAEQATELGLLSWVSNDGRQHYLIDNGDLRESVGWLIGRIGRSHWLDVVALPQEFPQTVNPPVGYPAEWRIDGIKCACLLRLADAAHIDARRAPPMLRALRSPGKASDNHWAFQGRMHQAAVIGDRIEFTASPFPASESDAWWAAREALRTLDRELHAVDVLLADLGRPRLQVRMIIGVDDPERLTAFIPTEGWRPVDAEVHVADVAKLVETLGGSELYGNNSFAPLRELLQNGTDAIRARQLIDPAPPDHLQVTVAITQGDEGPQLEVRDSGVGMSERVVLGALLAFGRSLWRERMLAAEYPGLAGSGWNPTGRFGIGFFAVFMWARAVKVTTRQLDKSSRDTLVLDFPSGLTSRPMLRPAIDAERLGGTGTVVRLDLKDGIVDEAGNFLLAGGRQVSLARTMEWLWPASDIEIATSEGAVVRAGDWVDLPAEQLLRRTEDLVQRHPLLGQRSVRADAEAVRPIVSEDGELLGRAVLAPTTSPFPRGVITVGGAVAGTRDWFAGVLIGQDPNVARSDAQPVAGRDALASWATEQAKLADLRLRSWEEKFEATANVLRLNGATGPLPVAVTPASLASCDGLRAHVAGRTEVVLAVFRNTSTAHRSMASDAVLIYEHSGVTPQLLLPIIAEAWGTHPDQLGILSPQTHDIGARSIVHGVYRSADPNVWGFTEDYILVEHTKRESTPDWSSLTFRKPIDIDKPTRTAIGLPSHRPAF